MFEKKIAKYKSLNQLAEADGTVIFGTSSDVNIPLGELKQALVERKGKQRNYLFFL